MECSWRTDVLAMLGKRDRFTRRAIEKEFSEGMSRKYCFENDLGRKLEESGERYIFATRVVDRYTLYWELNKDKHIADVLAIHAGVGAYFKSVKFLEEFIRSFLKTNSSSGACHEVVSKYPGETVFKNW